MNDIVNSKIWISAKFDKYFNKYLKSEDELYYYFVQNFLGRMKWWNAPLFELFYSESYFEIKILFRLPQYLLSHLVMYIYAQIRNIK